MVNVIFKILSEFLQMSFKIILQNQEIQFFNFNKTFTLFDLFIFSLSSIRNHI